MISSSSGFFLQAFTHVHVPVCLGHTSPPQTPCLPPPVTLPDPRVIKRFYRIVCPSDLHLHSPSSLFYSFQFYFCPQKSPRNCFHQRPSQSVAESFNECSHPVPWPHSPPFSLEFPTRHLSEFVFPTCLPTPSQSPLLSSLLLVPTGERPKIPSWVPFSSLSIHYPWEMPQVSLIYIPSPVCSPELLAPVLTSFLSS